MSEDQGKTVVEAYPESAMADKYKELAEKILEVSSDDVQLYPERCV